MRIHHFASAIFSVSLLFASSNVSSAETISQALSHAYAHNPTLNAARAQLRVTNEGVAIAKSGYRPNIYATGTASKIWNRNDLGSSTIRTGTFGIDIDQTIFDGFATKNAVRSAVSGVKTVRENLRNTEQNVLLNAAISYMDVIANKSILGFRQQSLTFLKEQVRSEQTRFDVGESTRTDVAQARGRLEASRAQLSNAKSNYEIAISQYKRYVGKKPGKLTFPKRSFANIPKSMNSALKIAMQNHPALLATRHNVDQALYNVKQSEGSLLPSVNVNGSLDRVANSATGNREEASVTAKLSVPLYQRGQVSATIRQNKETLGRSRILVNEMQDQVQQAIVQSYNERQSAIQSVAANKSQLSASRLALEGAIEERRVGQRTTLDVLDTQQEVINAQIALIQSQRNLVVANYAILSSVGSLSASNLSLNAKRHDPEEHFIAVKDKWYGLRTPNGQ